MRSRPLFGVFSASKSVGLLCLSVPYLWGLAVYGGGCESALGAACYLRCHRTRLCRWVRQSTRKSQWALAGGGWSLIPGRLLLPFTLKRVA